MKNNSAIKSDGMKRATLLFFMLLLVIQNYCCLGFFKSLPTQNSMIQVKQQRNDIVKVKLVPQIVFAAACAGAVFSYVYNNIDSIKEVRFLSLYYYL